MREGERVALEADALEPEGTEAPPAPGDGGATEAPGEPDRRVDDVPRLRDMRRTRDRPPA